MFPGGARSSASAAWRRSPSSRPRTLWRTSGTSTTWRTSTRRNSPSTRTRWTPTADLRDFDDLADLDTEKLALYQNALDTYESSGIEFRVMRTDFVGVSSDLEYLAKLHCLRTAFNHIMEENSNRDWWTNN